MPRTFWLASYPKSGNTWFRIFIANLLYPEQAPVSINQLPVDTPIASARIYFDTLLGVPSALLSSEEIECLRPEVDQELSRAWKESLLLRKVHDAYTYLADGRPMLGNGPNFAALYILRDPWDVAISMSNHFACSQDQAIENMGNSHFTIGGNNKGLPNQLAQRLLSWEGHVQSWLNAPLDLYLMRYEDMRRNPLPVFRNAVRFLGLEHSDQAIEAALEACRFERLQRQEREQRFKETPYKTQQFFRSGRVGDGLEALGREQIQRLETMKQRVELIISKRGLSS